MSYENLANLKALSNVLEMLDHLIDDEEYFNSDIHGYSKDIHEHLESSKLLLQEMLEDDPDLPVNHASYIHDVDELRGKQSLDYNELQQFGVDELAPFINEVEELLSKIHDAPKRMLFDQLTIPIMSLVNHQSHPTRPGYLVYYFKMAEHAAYFEELLKEKELFYERFDENRNGEPVFWFGVREQDHDAVEIINYTVKGKFRKPLIKDTAARYVVIAFGVIMILFALIGAIISNM